jgi:dienelactone hydrolase
MARGRNSFPQPSFTPELAQFPSSLTTRGTARNRGTKLPTDKPEVDRKIEIQAVVDLRRGIDLLLARSDVDQTRLAYVGHSYGAQWGSILPPSTSA